MGALFFLLADVPLSNFLQGIFARQTPLVFLGMAVVLTMAVGEFDLSFPSIYALSGASVSSLVILHGWSFPLAALAAVGLALLFGAANALLVVRAGINSVIVTLGLGSLAVGPGRLDLPGDLGQRARLQPVQHRPGPGRSGCR